MYNVALSPDYYPHSEHYVEPEDIERLESGKEWVEELIACIYYKGDIEGLENALEELAHVFDLKIPETDPVIQSKTSKWLQLGTALMHAQANSFIRPLPQQINS